jgi:outer membrane protein OmpA-like peptidoglycan-associated protein
VELSLGGTALSSGQTAASATIPASVRAGQNLTCTVRATISTAETTIATTAPIRAAASTCSAKARSLAVFFSQLDSSLSRDARGQLRRLRARDCSIAVTGYVEPTPRLGNDESLSRARARSVAAFLRNLGADITSIEAGRRDLQTACKPASNRCVIVRLDSPP